MSAECLNELLKEYRIDQIVMQKIWKWSVENLNKVQNRSEIPECVQKATLLELFATQPFAMGSSV